MTVPFEKRGVYAHTVEGFFLKGIKKQLTERLLNRVRDEAGIDLRGRLEVLYPMPSWERSVCIAAEEIHPNVERHVAFEALGAALTQGYFDTLVGQVIRPMVVLLGPARTMHRIEASVRSANNYTESSLIRHATNRYSVIVNEVGPLRDHLRGAVRRGLEVAGAQNLRCEVSSYDDERVILDISWDE